jgi:hypothetical protein
MFLQFLHWIPGRNRWVEITIEEFATFVYHDQGVPEAVDAPPGFGAGLHFIVTYNGDVDAIVPHKYLIEPSGKIARDNFAGWTKEEREYYERLAWVEEHLSVDQQVRLDALIWKMRDAKRPAPETVRALKRMQSLAVANVARPAIKRPPTSARSCLLEPRPEPSRA